MKINNINELGKFILSSNELIAHELGISIDKVNAWAEDPKLLAQEEIDALVLLGNYSGTSLDLLLEIICGSRNKYN